MKNMWKKLAVGGACVTLLGLAAMTNPPVPSGGATPKQEAKTAKLGEKAPDFTLVDHEGKTHKLSDYKGKTVVLEWFNPECPFVVWHYQNENGQLKNLYKEMKKGDKDLVWLVINSGAPGEQGTGLEKNQGYHKKWEMAAPILFDETGIVGKAYDAKTSPHMYLINAEGVLLYHGAIDNAPNGRVRGGGEVVNFLKNAYTQMKAGETVSPDFERPYGCNVKYKN